MDNYRIILKKYLPEASLDRVLDLLQMNRIHLHISKSRVTKFGDFRPSSSNIPKITVNHNLNPYSFLITLLHEISHVIVWNQHGRRIKPHGKEWKATFRNLMQDMVDKQVFPSPLEKAVRNHIRNPKASSSTDIYLSKLLREFDSTRETLLDDLELHTLFAIHNGKRFRKMERRKKRFRCICLDNGKIYLMSPLMGVHPVEDN